MFEFIVVKHILRLIHFKVGPETIVHLLQRQWLNQVA